MKTALLTATLLLFPLTAHSQPADTPQLTIQPLPSLNETAKSFYDQGVAALQAKDWLAARNAFLNAWKLVQHIRIAANLGWAELELTLYRDAAEHLDYVLKNAPPDLPTDDKQRTQNMFDQARQHIGALIIHVYPQNAALYVNGTLTPPAKILFLEPGMHAFEVRLDGYRPLKQAMQVSAGAPDESIHVKLQRSVEPVLNAPTEDDHGHGPSKPVLYMGIGLTASSFVATGIFAGMAISSRIDHAHLYDQFESCAAAQGDAPCRSELRSVANRWATSANLALGSGIATVVLGAALAGYWLVTNKSSTPSEEHIQVAMHLERKGGGALISIPW